MADEHVDGAEGARAISGLAKGKDGIGVFGDGGAVGVRGDGGTWHGVVGLSGSTVGGFGVYGKNTAGGTGVGGESDTWMGVYGASKSTAGGAGVMGQGESGPGIMGLSEKWVGVYGESKGTENGPAGVWGEHKAGGVAVKAVSPGGIGIHSAAKRAAVLVGQVDIDGDVHVTGDMRVTGDIHFPGADVAENFRVENDVDLVPGTVVVIAGPDRVKACDLAYDRRVVGVVSGAGSYRPAMVLDDQGDATMRPLALTGKVWCLVDADLGSIVAGDLLTTSPTKGHAMIANEATESFGAVLGKALDGRLSGRGLVPMLVSLN